MYNTSHTYTHNLSFDLNFAAHQGLTKAYLIAQYSRLHALHRQYT